MLRGTHTPLNNPRRPFVEIRVLEANASLGKHTRYETTLVASFVPMSRGTSTVATRRVERSTRSRYLVPVSQSTFAARWTSNRLRTGRVQVRVLPKVLFTCSLP